MSVLELNGRVFDASTTGTLTLTGEGNATTDVTQGLAKAWATLTGTSTASLDDSLNVASITDVGTGDYTTTYTSAFSSATKSAVCAGGFYATNVEVDGAGTASSNDFLCKDTANDSVARDADVVNTSVHGDLA